LWQTAGESLRKAKVTIGTGSLSADGHATFSISSLSKGTHSITATYGGNDNLDGCSSSVFSQTINR
jgi:predicted secreted protein